MKNVVKKVLIANRGEIAVRVIRACNELGIKTVAIYSEADKDSLHVQMADESICIGKSQAFESYLNIPNIISACEVMGVDAVHPGFGFLSEDFRFAEICEEANIIYIGPKSNVIRDMGDKSKAKKLLINAGIPIIGGSTSDIESVDEALKCAKKIGYPVLLKASFGGGGKGIRVARNDIELKKQFKISKLESKKCFGRDELYIEKYIENAKHIEFQILADEYGNVVHLCERECSMQRNKQKVLEECPSIRLSNNLRKEMGQVAIKVAKVVGYENAGTVEFLLDQDDNYYFVEMNTRIQVEHPLTEEVTGIDIVKEQIKIASGEKLSISQNDINIKGHAIECRINAENPLKKFLPCPGVIEKLIIPGGKGIRIDSGIYEDNEISQYYDSMIVKIISHGTDREEAINKMQRALSEMVIKGVDTNIDFEQWLLRQKEFLDGSYTTEFLAERLVNSYEDIK